MIELLLNDTVSKEITRTPDASFLDAAIVLSLDAPETDFEKKRSHESATISLGENYMSSCVMEHQQFLPVSVLALMWNISEANAEDICLMFSFMSLANISTQMIADVNNVGCISMIFTSSTVDNVHVKVVVRKNGIGAY